MNGKVGLIENPADLGDLLETIEKKGAVRRGMKSGSQERPALERRSIDESSLNLREFKDPQGMGVHVLQQRWERGPDRPRRTPRRSNPITLEATVYGETDPLVRTTLDSIRRIVFRVKTTADLHPSISKRRVPASL